MTRMHSSRLIASTLLTLLVLATQTFAQSLIAPPDRRADEGAGPFSTLLIKNAIVIDGTGAPPVGPTNIVVKQNRIEQIGGFFDSKKADHVVDASGMYVLPGFIDMHAHCGSGNKAPQAEYVFKLWLAHGVTTVRGVPLARNDWTVREQERSRLNQTVAPRIINYQRPPGKIRTPEEAREWVRNAPLKGIQGLKLGAYRPEIMKALLDEAKRLDLGSVAHLHQMGVARMDAMDSARLGLQSVTHYYGHFEALLKDHVVQPWPTEMNYNDEQFRFGQVARLWDKIHPPGSPEWNAYLKEHLELGTVFDPTFTIYSASRDVMRARTAEWHDEYTIPSLWNYFQPSRKVHGSYWFYWTTEDEVAWRNFYQIWFQLVNDYKKMGGRVTTGADSGFIYDTYGFGYIEELELLQEAGFHPLEVIQCATMNGAQTIHEPMNKPIEFGVLREGLLADMVIVPANPLENFKVLFGTGAVKLNEETDTAERVGGIRWTIKDGIIYDAHKLLADVREMVRLEKQGIDDEAPDTPTTSQREDNKPTASKISKLAEANERLIEQQKRISELRMQLQQQLEFEKQKQADDVDSTKLESDKESETLNSPEGLDDSKVIAITNENQMAWGLGKDGKWVQQSLANENGSIARSNSNAKLGWVRVNDNIYAFSSETGTWDALQLTGGAGENVLNMRADSIIVQSGDTVSAFRSTDGQWNKIKQED